MLDCARVELFKEYAIVPSSFYWRDFICSLFAYVLRIDSHWNFHNFKRVGFKEKSESVPSDLFSCQLFTSHNTVRSCLQESS